MSIIHSCKSIIISASNNAFGKQYIKNIILASGIQNENSPDLLSISSSNGHSIGIDKMRILKKWASLKAIQFFYKTWGGV